MKKKTYLVLGLGIAGKAVVNQLISLSCSVIAIDKKKEVLLQKKEILDLVEKGLVLLKDDDEIIWGNIEMLVLSPGIILSHPIVVKASSNNVPVIDEITFALSFLKNKIIGITGSNGKTTLTYLLEHIFISSNKKAKAVGNVGIALSSYISNIDENEVLFLELSSFQLEMLNKPFLDAAVILNISPDHLDRYDDFLEYAKAKINIQNCLKKEKKLFLPKEVQNEYFSFLDNEKTIVLERFCNKNIFDNLSYNKTITIQTIMAAYCICKYMNVDDDEIIKGFSSFVSLPHRLEYVTTIGGVNYYNDSTNTNVIPIIRMGEVISITDPTKSGRIQVRITGIDDKESDKNSL